MNGGKSGIGKKSGAHLSGVSAMGNGSIGANHGYGPIGGGLTGMSGPAATSNLPSYAAMGNLGMNLNVYKQQSSNGNSNIKESISFSKINAKMKKKQQNNNMNGLQ